MKRFLKTTIISGMAALSAAGFAVAQQASNNSQPGNVMMVLDGSNSMWGQIDGTAKISIAKDVMTDLISTWDPKAPLGMLVYGHRRKNDCKDIELISTPGLVDRKTLINKVQSITPRGKTPISSALTVAAGFGGSYLGRKLDLILVSDGLETCNADPCATAASIKAFNANFKAHIIGFDVDDVEFKQLQCIATETGGGFYRANNAKDLQDALAKTIAAVNNDDGAGNSSNGQGNDSSGKPGEIEPATLLYGKLCETCERLEPLDVNWNVYKDGKQHFQGLGVVYPNDEHQFEPGDYQVAVRFGSSVVTASGEITIAEDGKQIGEINLNAGSAFVSAFATDDKTLPQGAFFRFFPIVDGVVSQKQIAQTGNKNLEVWLPAGKYKVTAQVNQVEESAEIEIIAGQNTKYEFDLRVGYVRPDVVLFEGGKISRAMFYRLLNPETGAQIAISNGVLDVPIPAKPGKYDLLVQHAPSNSIGRADVTFPIEIKAGETIRGPYVLNVGRFEYNITSKSGLKIGGVWLQRVNEGGGATQIGFASTAKHQGVAPAGTYRFRVRVGDEFSFTGPFEVVPGEIRELNIEFP